MGPTLAGALFDATISYHLPLYFKGSCFIANNGFMVASKPAGNKR